MPNICLVSPLLWYASRHIMPSETSMPLNRHQCCGC